MINNVILIGRLGGDPETHHTQDGAMVVNMNIATNEQWKDKSGEKQERTEWHRVVAFRKLAEICNQYLSKGSLVYIEGRLQTKSWDDKEGKKRYTTEIVASTMKMLDGKNQTFDQPKDTNYSSERKDDRDPFDFGEPPF